MKKRSWAIALGLTAVVAISATLYTMSHRSPSTPSGALPDTGIIKFTVTRENISNTIDVKGKSAYSKETWVVAPFSAEIKKWLVKEGNPIHKGDPLFELENKGLQSEIAKLETVLERQQLEQKLNAIRSGASGKQSEGVVTEEQALAAFAEAESDKIKRQLDRLDQEEQQAALSDKRALLQLADYKAPESGIFLFAEQKNPRIVQDKQIVGKIVDLSQLKFVTSVSEFEVFQIKPGMTVNIKVDALKDVKLRGTVEQVSKFATQAQGTGSSSFEVTISIEPNDRLIAGLSLTGTLETDKKDNALVVPTLAVQSEKEQSFVYVAGPSGVEKRPIRTGLVTPDKTEVLEGLKEGDTAIIQ